MTTDLVKGWSAQWPLPVVAISLLTLLLVLRFRVAAEERGRVKAGIFFAGAYLVALAALGARLPVGPGEHTWARVLTLLLFSFGAVLTAGLLLFDVVLARRELPRILRDLIHAVAYLITAAVVLTRSDVDVTKVFTASVLTTAVIGLALQETLGNIMAGLALQLERDFEIGDWVKIDDRITGRVREVRWRATTVVTKNGDLVLVPNGVVARSLITNFSRPTTAHRQWVTIRVHFRHPPGRVRAIVEEAVRAQAFVRADPPPDCLLLDFKEDACTYGCRFWIDDFLRDEAYESAVRSAIWYALHRAGMEIPFPSMNINVTEMNQDREDRKHDEEYARRVDALSRVDVFRALDAGKIDRLARRLRMIIYGPGEVVLRKGDPGDSLYVVRTGSVAVQLGGNGAVPREVATLSAGQFFGEMSLMTGESRAATVVAKTDCECYIVDKQSFQEVLEERPELAGIISEILLSRQVELSGATAEAARGGQVVEKNDLRSRIAAFFGLGGGFKKS
jgi:small-conductance mechanosensitive channel/CRP-like cAMP-binding protein